MDVSQGDRPFNEKLSNADALEKHAITVAEKGGKHSKKGMHDRIAVWCNSGSCEAEPYWIQIWDQILAVIISDHKDVGMKEWYSNLPRQ